MDEYRVKKIENAEDICVSVPGSKSITNRALLLAAMSNGVCEIEDLIFCDDSIAMIECLKELGFEICVDEEEHRVSVRGENGRIPNRESTINVRSAGTTARFMTAFLAVVGGNYTLNSSEQMKKRPMKDFLDVLEEQGVEITYLEEEGHFPFKMASEGLSNIDLSIDTTTSTQYASALLMAGAISGIKLQLTGKRIRGSFIKITLHMIHQFGIQFQGEEDFDETATYRIEKQEFSKEQYKVEPDMSSACYFYAMAVILGVKTRVNRIHLDSMQGDIKFIYLLERLGAKMYDTPEGLEVNATELDGYDGIDIDMSDFSDQALTMAVVAAFAKSKTTIRNIGHARKQESDRVQAMANEIRKIGCNVEIIEHDGQTDVEITPGELNGGMIETYEDHRVAMSFALIGLVVDDVIIKDPSCTKKTFEKYFNILDKITD